MKREQALAMLKERGPMTIRELAGALGWEVRTATEVVNRSRQTHPRQHFRICSYVEPPLHSTRTKSVPRYAAEAGIDLAFSERHTVPQTSPSGELLPPVAPRIMPIGERAPCRVPRGGLWHGLGVVIGKYER